MRLSALLRTAGVTVVLATVALTGDVAPAAELPGCDDATTVAAAAPETQIRAAVRCLLNDVRQGHGRRRVLASGALNAAADRHAGDMVARGYFSHVTPEGRSVVDRVRATGYLAGSGDWALGEDIGWGTGVLSTPSAMVDAWMRSPPHRAVILNRDFTQIGIGVARGVPVPIQGDGATFVLDFGDVTR